MDSGFGIDSLLFTLGLVLLTLFSIRRKWSRTERIRGKALGAEVRRAIGLNRLSLYFGFATGALVLLGILAAGTSARARLRNIQTYVGGIAPTLAGELTRREHWKLDLNTPPRGWAVHRPRWIAVGMATPQPHLRQPLYHPQAAGGS